MGAKRADRAACAPVAANRVAMGGDVGPRPTCRGRDAMLRMSQDALEMGCERVERRVAVTGLLLALTAAMGCRAESEAISTGGRDDRNLIEHALDLGSRMSDQRLRAALVTGIAEGLAGVARSRPSPSQAPERSQALQTLAIAEQIVGKVSDPSDKELAVAAVSRAYAHAGNFERALQAADAVRSDDRRSLLFADLSALELESGDVAGAAALAPRIPDEETRSQAFVKIIRVYANTGKMDEANDLLPRCTKKPQHDEAVAALVGARAAKKMWGPAEKLADTIQSGHFRSIALAAILTARYAAGEQKPALKLFARIESEWITARTYGDLALIARRTKHQPEAEKHFERAVSTADSIHDEVVRASALEDLAMRAMDLDRPQDAMKLARKSPSREGKHRIMAALVARYAKAGSLTDAQPLAAELAEDPVWGASAVGALAAAEADAGDAARALALVASIPNVDIRTPIIGEVVAHQSASGKEVSGGVLAALQRALQLEPRS